jgi:RND family efflux transporter MFP subunit
VQRLEAVGDGRSLRSAELTAEVSGRVAEVDVSAGDRVVAGERIIRLDDRSEQLALERARLNLEDRQVHLGTVERMAATASISESELRDARSAVRSAQLQVQEAELALSRREVLAPFTGIVSSVSVQVGNLVGVQTTVARLDDRSRLQIAFRIPERFISAVSLDQAVQVTTTATGMPTMMGVINELDGRLDSSTRTLEVLAEVDNSEDLLRPGMSFQIAMEFSGDEYFAIHPLAIQWNMEGPFLWALDENKRADQVPIQIIQRREQDVLVAGDLAQYEQVVIEGVQTLRPGVEVTTELSGRRP